MAVELRAGVGTDRPNHKQDVALVQFFLSGTGATVSVDGTFGTQTSTALAAFQNAKLGFTDGVVDPGDVTFKMLRGDFDDGSHAVIRAMVLGMLEEMQLGSSAIEQVPTADGKGLKTTWEEGPGIARIFSHHIWGTWEVRGAILSRYLELDEDAGPLGPPVSGERDHGFGGRISFFRRGRIEFGAGGVSETILPAE